MSALERAQVTLFDRARNYNFIFYLFGQNSCNPHLSSVQNWSKLANIVPSIISVLSNLFIAIVGIIYRYNYDGFYEQTDSVVTYILLVLQFLTNLVSMWQSIYYASTFRAIYDKMETVRVYITENLEYKCEFEQFGRQYRRNAIFIAFIYFTSVLIKFTFTSVKTHLVVQSAQMLLLAYTLTDNVHTLFYVELLLFFLVSMTSYVRDYANYSVRRRSHYPAICIYEQTVELTNLRNAKRIYYLLYDVSILINERFGWGLVALLLMNFCEVAYSSFWIFLYLNAYHSHLFISNLCVHSLTSD